MTSPLRDRIPAAKAAFSAEDVTEAALKTAFSAAAAGWLDQSQKLVMSGKGSPNLSLMQDGARFVADAVTRAAAALREAWVKVFARTGTDLRPYMANYLDYLPYRLDGLSNLAWRKASTSMSSAQAAFSDMDTLRDAVRQSFSPSEYEGYVNRIAATEANIAVNMARHDLAMAAYNNGATVEKTWKTRRDDRVRHTHQQVQNVTLPLATPFQVGGWPMMHPGDITAPPELVQNCRCGMDYHISGGRR